MSEYIYQSHGEPLANECGEIHLARAGEIVRCRDCEHAEESESGALFCNGYLVEPWDWYNDMPSNGVKVKPDDFCAWPTRKERIES